MKIAMVRGPGGILSGPNRKSLLRTLRCSGENFIRRQGRSIILLAGMYLLLQLQSKAAVVADSTYKPHYISFRNTSTFTTSLFAPRSVKSSSTTIGNGIIDKPKKTWFKAMRYSGFARFYPYYRNMKKYYDIQPSNTFGLTLPVNLTADDGYQQPMILLKLEGNPSAKTWFQMELQFDNFLKRTTLLTDTTGKLANLYVLFQLQGSVDTRIGHFKMTAGGGVNWFRLSPSTLWQYQWRDDMFERYPWEPEGHDFVRYHDAYSTGDIPRDQRFGMQGTQGFILEATKLPGNFEVALLYGKSTTGGGFRSYVTQTPLNMFASRVSKLVGAHRIGFNYFNQFGYFDNKVHYKPIVQDGETYYVQNNYVSQLVTTVDARIELKNFNIFAEVGGGSYLDSNYAVGLRNNARPGAENVSLYKRKWGETMFLEITTKKKFAVVPLRFSVYRISPHVVNVASSVANTSVEQVKPSSDTPDAYNTFYYDGLVTDVGQLANNRQGFNLMGSKKINKLILKLGWNVSQEVVNLAGDLRNGARGDAIAGASSDSSSRIPYTNSITFEHRLNGLTNSRFAPYQRFTGPYDRMHSIFRRTFENIAITDTLVDYKKSFSTVNFEIKYKFKLFKRDLIVTNFNNYSSVQDHWALVPVFSDKAFMRIFYEEFMVFYSVHPKITLVGFWGMERVVGNSRTELADADGNLIVDGSGKVIADPNGKPVNQTTYGFGQGIDYNFHSRASLHLRHRWFTHTDKHYTRDQFEGNEVTMEFKVFF